MRCERRLVVVLLALLVACGSGADAPTPERPDAVLTAEESAAVDAFARAFPAASRGDELGLFVRGAYPPAALLEAWRADGLRIVAGRSRDGTTLSIREIEREPDGALTVRATHGGACKEIWVGTVTGDGDARTCEVTHAGVGCILP